jgi:hypothetical protein
MTRPKNKPVGQAALALPHAAAPTQGSAPAPGLSPTVKLLASLAIAFHLLAVFVGPWAVPPFGSQLARLFSDCIGPYVQAGYLNNGYRFFAPEPGPGHLIRYEITTRDGRQVEGSFPDSRTEKPRLLYHRYFMMSEFLNGMSNPENSEVATKFAESYANHLIHQYDATSVKLYLRQHRLPTADQVRGGMQLDDPSLYDERLITSWTP